jgi:hypothetical protein
MKRDLQFWERVSERVIAEEVPDHWKFDTLIVDERQDFERYDDQAAVESAGPPFLASGCDHRPSCSWAAATTRSG